MIPTFLGFAVTDLLTEHFADLVNAEFTAEMEAQLDQIAAGEAKSDEHLSGFYFGSDGESGLKTRVQEKIDTIPFWALELSGDGLRLIRRMTARSRIGSRCGCAEARRFCATGRASRAGPRRCRPRWRRPS